MTHLTIDAINSNTLFAPLGEEANFKHRIFMDNLARCMTVREFQKTAGIEIKKKLTETPSAKVIKDTIKELKRTFEQFEKVPNLDNFGFFYFRAFKNQKENILKTCKKYYTTKKGKIIKSRKERVEELIINWNSHNRFFYKNKRDAEDFDCLMRIGFYRMMDSFEKEISKGDILKNRTYWELFDRSHAWITKHKNFYYSPNWNDPQFR